ncbi:hypothetical protein VT84_27900 [Gemmata sp. SH-PL17]|nr:hypothetical protein VT84_27900 [Gemmata sp. SH-PL17]
MSGGVVPHPKQRLLTEYHKTQLVRILAKYFVK